MLKVTQHNLAFHSMSITCTVANILCNVALLAPGLRTEVSYFVTIAPHRLHCCATSTEGPRSCQQLQTPRCDRSFVSCCSAPQDAHGHQLLPGEPERHRPVHGRVQLHLQFRIYAEQVSYFSSTDFRETSGSTLFHNRQGHQLS